MRRGDVVLTLLGNRPEWVLTMVACFRQGYVVLPCTEQLRPNDLRLRLAVAAAARSSCADERNAAVLAAAGWGGADAAGAPGTSCPRAHAPAAGASSRPRTRA